MSSAPAYIPPGGITPSEASGAYAPHGAATTRLRAVGIGDSTMAGGVRDVNATVALVGNAYSFTPGRIGMEQGGPTAWLTHLGMTSAGRLLVVHNAGVSSDTSTGCLARFQNEVVAMKPDIVFISGGIHNDIVAISAGTLTMAQARANFVSMITQARAAGIEPILVTAFPENNASFASLLRQHNAWLKNLAAGHDATYPTLGKMLVVDAYSAVVDPASASGAWLAAYTADGIHPNIAGAKVVAAKILADLGGLLRGNATNAWGPGPFAATDRVGGRGRQVTDGVLNGTATITSATAAFASTDVGRPISGAGIPANSMINSVTNATTAVITPQVATATGTGVTLTLGSFVNSLRNPLASDDVNADGKADSWTVVGNTVSLDTIAGIPGKAQHSIITSSTGEITTQNNVDDINFSVGEVVKFAGLAKVVSAAGSLQWNVQLSFPGKTPIAMPMSSVVGVDYDWFYFEVECVIPVGATVIRGQIISSAGTGELYLAQPSMINMSRL